MSMKRNATFDVLHLAALLFLLGWLMPSCNDSDSDDDDDDETVEPYEVEAEDLEESEYIDGYAATDLGLSVKWATCNIGAESPEDYGNYYAWGETETKSLYSVTTSVTYGVNMDDFSGDANYDAAAANWGGSWRMPTSDEMTELMDDCTWDWAILNDIYGYLVTGDNGNSIFFPFSGYYSGTELSNEGFYGFSWTSTPDSTYTDDAYCLFLTNDTCGVSSYNYRLFGRPVRAVSE